MVSHGDGDRWDSHETAVGFYCPNELAITPKSCLLTPEEADGVYPWPDEVWCLLTDNGDDVASGAGSRRHVISPAIRWRVELRPMLTALEVFVLGALHSEAGNGDTDIDNLDLVPKNPFHFVKLFALKHVCTMRAIPAGLLRRRLAWGVRALRLSAQLQLTQKLEVVNRAPSPDYSSAWLWYVRRCRFAAALDARGLASFARRERAADVERRRAEQAEQQAERMQGAEEQDRQNAAKVLQTALRKLDTGPDQDVMPVLGELLYDLAGLLNERSARVDDDGDQRSG